MLEFNQFNLQFLLSGALPLLFPNLSYISAKIIKSDSNIFSVIEGLHEDK